MSDATERDAVLEEFAHDAGVHRVWGVAGMADEILRLRAENAALKAAAERVRALHQPIARGILKCVVCKDYAGNHLDLPCPTLHAL